MEFSIPLPNYDDEASSSVIKWKLLKERFKEFSSNAQKVAKTSVTSNSSSLSLLLHVGGLDVEEMIQNFITVGNFTNCNLHDLIESIENRCLSILILVYERFKFFSYKQQKSDDIESFITELKRLADSCELENDREKYLTEKLISSVYCEKLQKKLHSVENLDFSKAVEICCQGGKGESKNWGRHSSKCKVSKPRGKQRKSDRAVRSNSERKNSITHENEKLCVRSTRTRNSAQARETLLDCQGTNMHFENQSAKAVAVLSTSSKPKQAVMQAESSSKENTGNRLSRTFRAQKSSAGSRKIVSTSLASQSKCTLEEVEGKTEQTEDVCEPDNSNAQMRENISEHDIHAKSIYGEYMTVNLYATDVKEKHQAVKLKVAVDAMEHTMSANGKAEIITTADQKVTVREGIKGEKSYRARGKTKKCPTCSLVFSSGYMLRCHTRIHTGRRSYRCEICNTSFVHSGTRSRHMRQLHPEMLKFKCEDCDMLFELQTALNLHKLSHSKNQEMTCEDCGQTFSNTKEHFQHRRKEHKNTRYNCEYCGHHFPYPSKLKLHMMSRHSATKPYMCEICGSSFAEKNMLVNHKNIHTGEKKHECTTCGRRFLLKTTLNNHMQTHLDRKPYTCDVCGLNFKLSCYLKSHMKTHSENRARPHICSTCGAAFLKAGQLKNHERKHTGEKPFKCEICGTMFSQLSSMKKHIKQIHEGVKPVDRFSCEYCGLSFTHSCKLKLHLMKHTGERPFACKICGAAYRENHQLTSHMKIHNGEEPFKCSICGRRFLQKSYLEGHIRKHTGEKPFRCSICNAGFTQKGYLRDHVKVHDENRERKYKCSICGKAFTCSSHMRSHERLHSGEKPHTCDICGSRFTKKSSVKKHLRRTHGIHDSSGSSLIQEAATQALLDQSMVPVMADVQHANIQSEMQTDLTIEMQGPSHIHIRHHPEMHTDLTSQLRPQSELHLSSEISSSQVHSELGLQIHANLQPQSDQEISTGLQAVRASIDSQALQHPSVRIIHPEVHGPLHPSHQQMQNQILSVMSADESQLHHSEIVQEMHIYSMAN